MLLSELSYVRRNVGNPCRSGNIYRRDKTIEVWHDEARDMYDLYVRPNNEFVFGDRWICLAPLEAQCVLYMLLEKYPEK